MDRNLLLKRAVIAALASALPTFPLLAQESSAPDLDRTIESIVVTAQKREQNLQDVPIVVTAVSGQLLQDSGVRDIKDLTLLTPGLLVTSTSNESLTTARIRGIGTVGDNPGLESSVGVVVDGVYRPRNGVGFGDLGELERIEVLKGPQGTLFGKNTSAGVINVVSKKPSFDFGATAELTAGNYGDREASASITGPLTESLAGRLYAATRERDGFLDIDRGAGPRTDGEDADRKFYTVRGQLLFKPTDALDLRLVGDYTERDENCCAAPQLILAPGAAGAAVLGVLNALQPNSVSNPTDPFSRLAHANRGNEQSVKDKGASLEANWDIDALGGATLTSLTAWRDWDTVDGQDADFTSVDILYREDNGDYANEFKQLTQELRLSGERGQLTWLVGAFFADEDLDSHNSVIYGNQFRAYYNGLLGNALQLFPANAWPGGLGQRDFYKQEDTTWALFTNDSFRFTDKLELTVGLRYTDDSKDLDTRYANDHGGVGCSILRSNPAFVNNASASTIFGIGCATFADPIFNNLNTSQSLDEGEWTGTVKLAYRFNDDVMSYVSYARGYKAGGFNLDRERTGDPRIAPNPANPAAIRADLDTSFAKELVDSYELGVKTQWLNNTLLLNAAAFFQDYDDFQLNTFTGLQFVVTSLPRVTSKGVDLDMLWYTPLKQLTLQGGATYADTTIEDFGPALAFFRPERTDDRLSFAPKWSGSLSATYEQPVFDKLLVRANIGGKYTSKYNTGSNLDPRKLQDAMTIVNARIGFGADDERWMVEAWAQNLFDKEYVQVAFDGTLQGSSASLPLATSTIDGFLGAPRTYGLTARFKF